MTKVGRGDSCSQITGHWNVWLEHHACLVLSGTLSGSMLYWAFAIEAKTTVAARAADLRDVILTDAA